jgi:tetratricopeptide (TPR) repeat protein
MINALQIDHSPKDGHTTSFTEDPAAFDLYVKGRYEWNRRSSTGMTEAEKLFRAAIEKDPRFALAYVGLADRLALTSNFTEAEKVVGQALKLDPDSSAAHATLGFIDLFHYWKWQEAENELNRSIELNPGNGIAHQWLGNLFEIEGKKAAAIKELSRAAEIDPSSPNFEADLGQAYYFDHKYDEAKYHCGRALELDPDFQFAHGYLTYIGLITGDYALAINEWETSGRLVERYHTQSDEDRQRVDERYRASADDFRRSPPSKFLGQFIDPEPGVPEACYSNARAFALSGDREKALKNLECSIGTKNFGSAFINPDPVFDGLREEPRFVAILQKMNLPQ